MSEIFFAPATFGNFSCQPIKILKKYNFKHSSNLIGRKLLSEEIIELAHKAEGIIAGSRSISVFEQISLSYSIKH